MYWLFRQEREPPVESPTVEVEYREVKTEAKSPSRRKSGRTAGRGRGRGSLRGQGLSRFVSSGAGLFVPKSDADFEKIYAGAKGSSEWPEDAWGSHGADFAQYAEHTGHLDTLREEIEQMLYYPGVLARHRHKGVINARITFLKGSHCAFKKTRVEGANPYLRVYVLALISKVCGLSAIPRMGFRKNQKVDLSFKFYSSEGPTSRELDEQASRIAGNALVFQRGYTESSLEWELGPIRGVWFAPFISVDIPWIVENWEKHVDHKDPLRDFK